MSIYRLTVWYSVLVRGGQWMACLVERKVPRLGSESSVEITEMPRLSGYIRDEVLDSVEQLSGKTGIAVDRSWP